MFGNTSGFNHRNDTRDHNSNDDDGDDNYMEDAPWPMEEDIISGSALFTETYQVASTLTLSSALRSTVEYGNKIVMPASALDTLSRLNIMYPMMFRVTSERNRQRSTFCGVLEFSAPEGVVYLPPWMLKTLRLQVGDLVELYNVALPRGTFIKIKPQSVDFLDITDPRAVLEHSLRNFATLTEGDRIAIHYNDHTYELLVEEVRPKGSSFSSSPLDGPAGISVVETDLQVDFSPPVGYQEPSYKPGPSGNTSRTGTREEKSLARSLELSGSLPLSTSISSTSNSVIPSAGGTMTRFAAFSGAANRLSNKPKTLSMGTAASTSSIDSLTSANSTSQTNTSTIKGANIPAPLNLPKGTLYFGGGSGTTIAGNTSDPSVSPSQGASSNTDSKQEKKWTAFSGPANRLQ